MYTSEMRLFALSSFTVHQHFLPRRSRSQIATTNLFISREICHFRRQGPFFSAIVRACMYRFCNLLHARPLFYSRNVHFQLINDPLYTAPLLNFTESIVDTNKRNHVPCVLPNMSNLLYSYTVLRTWQNVAVILIANVMSIFSYYMANGLRQNCINNKAKQ